MHAHCKYWILAAMLSATFWMERVLDGQFLIGTTGARRGWNITKRKIRICASAYLRQMVKDKLQKTKISNILYNSLGDLVELMALFFFFNLRVVQETTNGLILNFVLIQQQLYIL